MSAKPSDAFSKISRRKFAQAATVAAAGAMVLPQALIGQAAPAKPESAASSPPADQPSLSPQEEAEVNSRIDEILRKYGSRMSEAEKADVRRQLREGQKSLSEMRAFPLINADTPATVLRIRPRDRR